MTKIERGGDRRRVRVLIPQVRMYHAVSPEADVMISLETFDPRTRELFSVAIAIGPDERTTVANARAYVAALAVAIDHAEREGWRHE